MGKGTQQHWAHWTENMIEEQMNFAICYQVVLNSLSSFSNENEINVWCIFDATSANSWAVKLHLLPFFFFCQMAFLDEPIQFNFDG